MGKLIYEPDYAYVFKHILSDIHNDENDINQSTFIKYSKHFNVIYSTKNSIPYKFSSYKYNKHNISSSTIKELDDNIIKCSFDDCYHGEMIEIVKRLPKELLTFSMIKIKSELPNILVPYHANNKDKILFVDNMGKLQNSINELSKNMYYHEINNLHRLTIRLVIPKFMIDEICKVTDNYEYTKCLFVNDDNSIGFNEMPLNASLKEYNENRIATIAFMYSKTKNEIYLSDDVLYKVYFTRTLSEWIDIINEFVSKYDIFNSLYKLLKNYPIIYNVLTCNNIDTD